MNDKPNSKGGYTQPGNNSKLRVLLILVVISAIIIIVATQLGGRLFNDLSEALPASESNKEVMLEIAKDVDRLPSGVRKSETQKYIVEAMSDDKVTKREIYEANELKDGISKSNTIDISKAREKIESKK